MTNDIPGVRIRKNKNALTDMPGHAYQQVLEAERGENATRANVVRTNASVPPDSWEDMDDAAYRTGERVRTIVQDLMDMGLTHSVPITAKHDTWGIIDDSGSATVGMTPEAQEPESSIIVEDDGSPVPIIDDGFSIGFREEPVNDSRLPESYDTTHVTVASRHVNEAAEEMFVDASNIQVTGSTGEGYTLYGMTDHPQTATGNTSADWTTDNTVIRSDLRDMRAILKNDRLFRPGDVGYMVYMGQDYYDTLDDADPEGDGNQTVRDRVENLSNIRDVKEADFLPDKSVLMFRPTEDVVQVGMGTSGEQTVQWEDPFRDHWRILMSVYPRIKRVIAPDGLGTDYTNGIIYWTSP